MNIYRGRIVELDVESVVLPNGSRLEMEIVRHPGGAAVVALDADGRVCLLNQYRHAVGGWLWELPAGKIDHREPPIETAVRELGEEAGVTASRWDELGDVISSPGVFTERIHLFLARDLQRAPASPDADEVFEVHWLPFAEALEWARSGDIVDGKTVIGLLRAEAIVGQAAG